MINKKRLFSMVLATVMTSTVFSNVYAAENVSTEVYMEDVLEKQIEEVTESEVGVGSKSEVIEIEKEVEVIAEVETAIDEIVEIETEDVSYENEVEEARKKPDNKPVDSKQVELAREAYIYGYPFVQMYELMHTQVINSETRKTGFNEFAHSSELASATTSFIPAPNNDTIYSRAWLDLRNEPAIIEVPDTADRYYTIQLLNFYSETIDNIGKRVYGTGAGKFAIVGPSWKGKLPSDVTVIKSDTDFVLAFLRVLVNGEEDLEDARNVQESFKVASLSRYNNGLTGSDNKDLNKFPEYKNSTAFEFYETLNNIIKLTPVLKMDKDTIKSFKKIGLGEKTTTSDLKKVDSRVFEQGAELAKVDIETKGLEFGESYNFWRIANTGVGAYGDDYMQRAVVWAKGALANVPEESFYPSTFQDVNGAMLDGNKKYEITFAPDQIPPVSQFWSLTMYIFKNGFLVDNELDRYSIGDRTKGLKYEEDGSLKIYVQSERPSEDKVSNWLPSPKESFYMTLRLYGPGESALNCDWVPPAVMEVVE